MLARLVAPSERLTLDLKPLDVCRDLLGTEPETVLMTIGGQDITAEQFAPTLMSTCSSYNHSHFASWSLEMSGRTTTDEAVDTLRGYVLCETLAQELDMELPACTADYQTGYRGLTAQGQTWTEEHKLLENQIVKAQGSLPADRLPDVTYAPAWETVNLTNIDARWPPSPTGAGGSEPFRTVCGISGMKGRMPCETHPACCTGPADGCGPVPFPGGSCCRLSLRKPRSPIPHLLRPFYRYPGDLV